MSKQTGEFPSARLKPRDSMSLLLLNTGEPQESSDSFLERDLSNQRVNTYFFDFGENPVAITGYEAFW